MDRKLAVALLMAQIVRSAYQSRHSADIQPLQWSILRLLGAENEEGRDLASIAAYAGVTAAPASRAVKTLEKRGLVAKGRHPEDRRAVSIRLTENGRDALKDDPIYAIVYRLSALSDSEFSAMSRGLRKLVLPLGDPAFADDPDSDR